MNRRRFLAMSAATALALPGSLDAGYEPAPFSPALWQELRASPDTVILNFRASWSLTCQIKADLLADLIAEEPEFTRLRIVEVDWDTYGPSQMAQRLKVERRSTLIVMKRGEEVTRIVNEPDRRALQRLLETALQA